VILHPVLNTYLIYDKTINKFIRAAIYYLRTLLILTFASLFGTNDDFDGIYDYLVENNLYLYILPYFTVIPINKLFECLVQDPQKIDANQAPIPWYKSRQCFGLFLGAIVSTIAIVVNYIGAAQNTPSQTRVWRYDFVFTLVQDLVLTPLIFMIL